MGMNICWIFIVLDNYFIIVKDFVLKLIISLLYNRRSVKDFSNFNSL